MKKLILIASCLISVMGVAEESSENYTIAKDTYTYIKFGATAVSAHEHIVPIPSFGLGRRFERDAYGIDFSYNLAYGEVGPHKKKSYAFYLPKVTYLAYIPPRTSTSIYLGIGSSWGGISDPTLNKRFMGIFGHAVAGIEFGRRSQFFNMIQMDVSQPLLSIKKRNYDFHPSVEVSYGIGF